MPYSSAMLKNFKKHKDKQINALHYQAVLLYMLRDLGIRSAGAVALNLLTAKIDMIVRSSDDIY